MKSDRFYFLWHSQFESRIHCALENKGLTYEIYLLNKSLTVAAQVLKMKGLPKMQRCLNFAEKLFEA